eukprot:CAMPEP_0183352048 /NCGR_PEP_ID=MMETSP0164_2-20130417/27199_1 /TAXON_ID=221442 /ORGANISM="Coccolithus pelagicus ssp braarudi, Strain PLY182g" /LENGTH=40 /DNA_ID= /DNA_START= /DNA_END= /DNA_ORIENTATION=
MEMKEAEHAPLLVGFRLKLKAGLIRPQACAIDDAADWRPP